MDIFDIRAKFSAALLLGAVWILLVMLPLMAAGVLSMPPPSFWFIFGGPFLYFFIQGFEPGAEAGKAASFCVL